MLPFLLVVLLVLSGTWLVGPVLLPRPARVLRGPMLATASLPPERLPAFARLLAPPGQLIIRAVAAPRPAGR